MHVSRQEAESTYLSSSLDALPDGIASLLYNVLTDPDRGAKVGENEDHEQHVVLRFDGGREAFTTSACTTSEISTNLSGRLPSVTRLTSSRFDRAAERMP